MVKNVFMKIAWRCVQERNGFVLVDKMSKKLVYDFQTMEAAHSPTLE